MLFYKLCALFYFSTNLCYCSNDRPVVGVLSQLFYDNIPPGIKVTSYISSGYVKYLESAGAQVVPITVDMTIEQIETLFQYINGVLLPGGDAYLMNSPYRTNAEIIYRLAMQANDDGDYFPIWGTCLGFEALCVIATKTDVVLSKSEGTWDKSLPLNFTENAKKSNMFRSAPEDVLTILERINVTYNVHRNCVLSDTFDASKELNGFFNVLSTNKDSTGMSFVSTIEAKKYPFYGVQWHPEWIFEFQQTNDIGKNAVHSKDAVYSSQYLANFFVNEARKSNHKFPNIESEHNHSIYNYKIYYYAKDGGWAEQIYIFN